MPILYHIAALLAVIGGFEICWRITQSRRKRYIVTWNANPVPLYRRVIAAKLNDQLRRFR